MGCMTNTTATRVRALLESGTLSPLLPIPPELYEGDWSSDAIVALVTSFAAVPVAVESDSYARIRIEVEHEAWVEWMQAQEPSDYSDDGSGQ